MLRVGLTGGLGSGKSTAGRCFGRTERMCLRPMTIGRELMQPGQAVYAAIVDHFGAGSRSAGGELDRHALARIAFGEGRVEELNAIVHPAVIARQAELAEAIFAQDPGAVVMVESALIFETKYGETKHGKTKHSGNETSEGWQRRFDRVILVTAPDEVKIARFVARAAGGRTLTDRERAELEGDARRRLDQQIPDEQKAALCDYVLTNGGPLTELEWQVDQLWPILKVAAA